MKIAIDQVVGTVFRKQIMSFGRWVNPNWWWDEELWMELTPEIADEMIANFNNKTYGKREMLTQWVDMLGFLYEPMYITKGEDNVAKGISANKGRVLGLSRTPAYVAGNRYGIVGEIPIPQQMGWNYLADAIHKSSGVDVFTR